MNVVWLHSFDPSNPFGGVFVHEHQDDMMGQDVTVTSMYTKNIRNIKSSIAEIKGLPYNKYDLVHAQYGSGCGYVGSYAKMPKVLTLRGSDWYGLAGSSIRRRVRSSLSTLLTRISVKKYDTVVTVSDRMKQDLLLESGVDSVVLPSAIDLDRFNIRDRQSARAELGYIDDDSVWILFSSLNIDNPIKRVGLAIEAVNILKKNITNAKLVFMSGVDRRLVPLMVSASNVILITSTHEGWPNIVKEGLASGIPFVSTDVSDLKDIARRSECCKVVSDSPSALATAIEDSIRASEGVDCSSLRGFVADMSYGSTSSKLAGIYERLVHR